MEIKKAAVPAAEVPEHSWFVRNSYRMGPLLLLLLSILFAGAAWKLELGTIGRPGPGLWPMAIAVLTGLLSILIATHSRKNEENFDLSGSLQVLYLLAGLVAYPFLFDLTGFFIPSLLIMLFMMRFLSKISWIKSVAVAVVATGIAYVLFGVLLNVKLPAFSL